MSVPGPASRAALAFLLQLAGHSQGGVLGHWSSPWSPPAASLSLKTTCPGRCQMAPGSHSAIRGLRNSSLGWLQGWAPWLQSGTEHRPCL